MDKDVSACTRRWAQEQIVMQAEAQKNDYRNECLEKEKGKSKSKRQRQTIEELSSRTETPKQKLNDKSKDEVNREERCEQSTGYWEG